MKNLTKLRNMLNLSQTELGNKVGFGQRAVSKWENSQAEPDIETLKKLATVFNCTVDELIDYNTIQQKQPEQIEPEKEELTKEQKELLELTKNLSIDDINKIIGYACSLNDKELTTEEKIAKLLKENKRSNNK